MRSISFSLGPAIGNGIHLIRLALLEESEIDIFPVQLGQVKSTSFSPGFAMQTDIPPIYLGPAGENEIDLTFLLGKMKSISCFLGPAMERETYLVWLGPSRENGFSIIFLAPARENQIDIISCGPCYGK